MKNFLLYILWSVGIGCSKSSDLPPVITITSPTDNQVFSAGQRVNIKGKIEDNDQLHAVHVVVTTAAGGHIIHVEEHFDSKMYDLDKSFTAQTATTYFIHIQATDHSGNTATKNLTVSAN